MSAPTVETVVLSELLSDLPKAAAEVKARIAVSLVRATVRPTRELLPVDVDFADTLAAGHVDSLNEWAWRVLGEAP